MKIGDYQINTRRDYYIKMVMKINDTKIYDIYLDYIMQLLN